MATFGKIASTSQQPSEIMAILVLAKDYADLRKRLGEIVIAESMEGHPIKAEHIEAAGAMALLLRNAFLPNLVQTLEGNPAFIHGVSPTRKHCPRKFVHRC